MRREAAPMWPAAVFSGAVCHLPIPVPRQPTVSTGRTARPGDKRSAQMAAEKELPLDETVNEELQDEELDDIAAGIECAPQQLWSEPERTY